MKSREIIWRALLLDPTRVTTQKELAERFGYSTSTVHAAMEVPRRVGAVRVGGRGVTVTDAAKLRTIWATFRNLPADTIATYRLRAPVSDVEGDMIPEARFTGPSAAKFELGFLPADYDTVLVYATADDLPKMEDRFHDRMHKRGQTVLRVVQPDPFLPSRVPLVQAYVDLWQLPDWWASEFLRYVGEALDTPTPDEREGRAPYARVL